MNTRILEAREEQIEKQQEELNLLYKIESAVTEGNITLNSPNGGMVSFNGTAFVGYASGHPAKYHDSFVKAVNSWLIEMQNEN